MAVKSLMDRVRAPMTGSAPKQRKNRHKKGSNDLIGHLHTLTSIQRGAQSENHPQCDSKCPHSALDEHALSLCVSSDALQEHRDVGRLEAISGHRVLLMG